MFNRLDDQELLALLADVGEDLSQAPAEPSNNYLQPLYESWSGAAYALPASLHRPAASGSSMHSNTSGEVTIQTAQASGKQPSAAAGKPKTRKRGPTSQQQVAELERQIREQTQAVQNLSLKNMWLSERVRMLEVVISVRNSQVERVKAIQAGLKVDPFKFMNSSVETVVAATPAIIAMKCVEHTAQVASQLSIILPHIQQNPYLMWGPTPTSTWVSPSREYCPGATDITNHWRTQSIAHQRTPHNPNIAGNALLGLLAPACMAPAPVNVTPDQNVLSQIQSFVSLVDLLQTSFQYVFWLKPELLLASSIHLQSIDPTLHSGWEQLLTSIKAASDEGTSAVGASVNAPHVAPDTHWKAIAASLMLTDHQRLQASVLHDLINTAINGVVSQRASLSEAMLKLNKGKELANGPVGGGPAPSAPGAPATAVAGIATGQEASAHDEGASESKARSVGTTATGLEEGSSRGDAQDQRQASWLKWPDILSQEEAIMRKLNMTLFKQGCLVMLGAEVLYQCILSPVQLAMALVGSYPYIPDHMAALHAIAAEYTPEICTRLQSK